MKHLKPFIKISKDIVKYNPKLYSRMETLKYKEETQLNFLAPFSKSYIENIFGKKASIIEKGPYILIVEFKEPTSKVLVGKRKREKSIVEYYPLANIEICKNADDYFYLKVRYKYYEDSKEYGNDNFFIDIYFKCDTLDGLKEFSKWQIVF
jgi:hypothetical protein